MCRDFFFLILTSSVLFTTWFSVNWAKHDTQKYPQISLYLKRWTMWKWDRHWCLLYHSGFVHAILLPFLIKATTPPHPAPSNDYCFSNIRERYGRVQEKSPLFITVSPQLDFLALLNAMYLFSHRY